MRRPVLLICALAALGGCREDDTTSVLAGCKDSGAVVAALSTAPAPVLLDGGPLSDCFASERPSGGDIQLVGATMLEAAQQLSEQSDAGALGYLVGSLTRDPGHQHKFFAEAVRRVEQEAQPFADKPTYERGLRAGRTSG